MRTLHIAILLATTVGCAWVERAESGDWANWRGPGKDGASKETNLPSTWSPQGENLLWRAPVGGRNTPLVLDGRVYVFAGVGSGVMEQERLVCLDADTGEILWDHRFPVFMTDIVSNRLGWSSPVGDPETGYVYVHGTSGQLICLDRDGKVVWEHSLTEQFGRVSGYGGRLMTPVVDEELVILSFLNSSWGGQARGWHRYVAFDKRTGVVVWWSQPGEPPLDTTYACPVVTVINGQRLLIAPSADGAVHALRVRTGELVWTFRLSKRGLNVSPVIAGNRVYVSHSEENIDTAQLGRAVCIDATGTGDVTGTHEVWRVEALTAGYSSPAFHDGRVYLIDNSANLYAYDGATGRELARHNLGTVGKGSPVWADGKIYVGEVNGRFHVLGVDADGFRSLDVDTFRNTDNTIVEIYGSPAVADGRVYFLTSNDLFCIGSRRSGGAADERGRLAAERPVGTEPKSLLVVPAEVTIAPGESVSFTVRAYDENGRFIRTVQADWSLPAPPPAPPRGPLAGMPQGAPLKGTIQSSGEFTADRELAYQAGTVLARATGLTASGRVRVVRPLPIRENFDDLAEQSVPAGWLDVMGKCRVVTRDGEKVLKKLASNPAPPFARVDVFARPPTPAGYTVTADVLGVNKGRRFYPDMGVLNCRYKLILMGTTARPKLRIVAWAAMPRLQEEVDFDWRPNVWYRAKFSVDIVDGQGRLRGKVWPRDEAEPDAWTIESIDPSPYAEGSPGLYAYSTGIREDSPGTEVFFDNFEAVPNR